jgi:hypothetical protein
VASARRDLLSGYREDGMQDFSYDRLVERFIECQMLAATARDHSMKEKAALLAHGYRNLLACADRRDDARRFGAMRSDDPGHAGGASFGSRLSRH